MTNGSYNEFDSNRPKWDSSAESNKVEFIYYDENSDYQFEVWKGRNKDGEKCFVVRRANDLSFSDRFEPEDKVDYFPDLGPRKKVLYRLPELIASTGTVFVVEGEKDVETLLDLDLTATCNPFGALHWLDEFSPWLKNRDVVILQDNDDRGEQHALKVQTSVRKYAASVKRILLPGLSEKGDVTDWLAIDGNTPEKLADIVAKAPLAKPVIHIRKGELFRYVDEAEGALLSEDIYQRADKLVRPYAQVQKVGGANVSFPCFADVSTVWLTDRLSEAATFLEYDSRRKREVPKNPPREIADTIIARTGSWKYPVINAVIGVPTLRPDGTIVSEAGYDEATGLYLFDPVQLPPIPDQPSREDCKAALAHLDELLNEFPFVRDEGETLADSTSRSVALSMLMTPVLRPAMDVAPLHLVTAPDMGSGKSYLVDLASLIFTGDKSAPASQGWDGAESDKTLRSVALEGRAFVVLDNVSTDITGDFLCQFVERSSLDLRPFNTTTMRKVRNTWVTAATGINVAPAQDMTRRTLVCRLDANVESPVARKFDFNPTEMIRRDRARYVADILTIARGFRASKKSPETPIPSFGEWSMLVRSALMWLDRADPWRTAEVSMAENPELVALRQLLNFWPSEGYLKASEIANFATEMKGANDNTRTPARPELRDGLLVLLQGAKQTTITEQAVGLALGRVKGRRIGNHKFIKDRKGFRFNEEIKLNAVGKI